MEPIVGVPAGEGLGVAGADGVAVVGGIDVRDAAGSVAGRGLGVVPHAARMIERTMADVPTRKERG
jgi:hypothetical protein